MKKLFLPLSAFLVLALPMESLAQSVSSSSMSNSSDSSVSSMSSSSLSSSVISSSSLSSSSLSSSSKSSSSRSSSRMSSSISSSLSSSSSRTGFGEIDFGDIDVSRYTDGPWDMRTTTAISALTRIGVLRGNDDTTFRADRPLNRAEFVEIIMRIMGDTSSVSTRCFPDVETTAWYAPAVCRAKAMGIIRGNARTDVSESLWRFEPSRSIQYEEAVKVLLALYAIPVIGDTEGADWYVPYIESAHDRDLVIAGLTPGDKITRGEMARITASVVAYAEGRLPDLREAETGASSRSSRSSSSSHMSSRSSTSMSASSRSGTYDPDTNGVIRSNFIVLGDTSPALAGVSYFSNNEAVSVEDITVTFTNDVNSISSIVIYDETGRQIGTGNKVSGSNDTFHANVSDDAFTLPYRANAKMYIRARTKARDTGGVSGEVVQVDNIVLQGNGQSTDTTYTSTSSDTFPEFETALGALTSVQNAASSNGTLITGTQQLLGEFRFTARSPNAAYDVRLLDLTFTSYASGGVTLSNVYLRTDGYSQQVNCSVSTSTITCPSLPTDFGTVSDTRLIRVYGDVANVGNNAAVRLTLNNPGTPTSAGAITWSDGISTFTWVQFDQPIANGVTLD